MGEGATGKTGKIEVVPTGILHLVRCKTTEDTTFLDP